jgi:GcrA cell cycle regulator
MRANWTAEEVKILNELKDNHTPAEIAKVITGKSRSAISSRMSRDRVKASEPSAQPEKKKRGAKKVDKTEENTCEDIEETEDIAKAKPFKKPVFLTPVRLHPLDKIGAHDCRWPFGTPGHADFAFCGEKTIGISPYCAEHTKMAFTPGTGYKLSRDMAIK